MLHNSPTEEYFKRKLYGGKNALARAVDFLALRLILLLSLYLWFSGLQGSSLLAWVITGVSLVLICICVELGKSIRMDSFKRKELSKLRREYEYERLLLLPRAEYLSLIRTYMEKHSGDYGERPLKLAFQQSEPLQKDMLLQAFRAAQRHGCDCVVLFSLSPLSPAAAAFAEESSLPFLTEPAETISRLARENGFVIDDGALLKRLETKLLTEKKQHKNAASPFVRGRIRKYALVALVLFAASFFVRYALYYRLMAVACMCFASLAWFAEGKVAT